MASEVIFIPEVERIRKDEFYLFYEMMMQSLKTDNVRQGLHQSLFLLRMFLQSGNVVLYKKNREGKYMYSLSDTKIAENVKKASCIVNKVKDLVEKKKVLQIDLNLSEKFKNAMFIYMRIEDEDCMLVITNIDKNKELESHFWERLRETMQVILKRAASYERNMKVVNIDLLTGLENRNSYELRLQSLEEMDENLVLGVFDLFRLKYINDNYTHNSGDVYIKETASILDKYWPKHKVKENEDGTESFIETGHCVYRVGGDEFVLLTSVDNLQLAEVKADLVLKEAGMIDLDVDGVTPIGLNYGMVLHKAGDNIKDSFAEADKIMQKYKTKMYQKYGIDRRK